MKCPNCGSNISIYFVDSDECDGEYRNYFEIDDPLFWQDELLSVIEKINHYDVDLNGCIDMSKKSINAIFNKEGILNEELFK